LQARAACRADDVLEAKALSVRVVLLLRTCKLSQTDGHHLHEAALDPPIEARMPFHPPDDHYCIGRVRGSSMKTSIPSSVLPSDTTSRRLMIGQAIDCSVIRKREHVRLSLRGRRTMATHRGKNEWRHSVAAPVLNDALDDRGDVGYAAETLEGGSEGFQKPPGLR
jgi:hypothetical protein